MAPPDPPSSPPAAGSGNDLATGLRDHVQSRLRADAKACFRAALAAVSPGPLVQRALAQDDLAVRRVREAAGRDRLFLAAMGKGAVGMVEGAVSALGAPMDRGVVITSAAAADASLPTGLPVFRGGHPVPTEAGIRGALQLRAGAQRLMPDDVVLALVSGGASSLAALPAPGLFLDDYVQVSALLLRAGAPIAQLNSVRKHIDQLKGGRLARLCAPAPVLALLISDVPGDAPDVIGSGPFSPDPTTFGDALQVLEHFLATDHIPRAVTQLLQRGRQGDEPETPKPGDACFATVDVRIVGHNALAREAVASAATRRGYRVMAHNEPLLGEARAVGRRLAVRAEVLQAELQPGDPPVCLVAGGETTVTVRGSGRGGRNQELALAAAAALDGVSGILIASLGTDGVDGPTDAAGGLADGDSVRRAQRLGIDPFHALARNDSHTVLAALGDLIITGATGTNVMDLALVLVWPAR